MHVDLVQLKPIAMIDVRAYSFSSHKSVSLSRTLEAVLAPVKQIKQNLKANIMSPPCVNRNENQTILP